MITQHRLKTLFKYSKKTGLFIWRLGLRRGKVAGSTSGSGHIIISVEGKKYLAHRLAWLYVKGKMPPMIDHEDRNKRNNSWRNLRKTDHRRNRLNSRDIDLEKAGVCYLPRRGRWWAYINVDGTRKSLRTHKTEELARAAYMSAYRDTFS